MEEVVAVDTAADGGSNEVQVKVSDTAPDKGLEAEWAPTYLRSAAGSPIDREDGGPIQPPIRCRRNIPRKTQVSINTCNLPSGLAILSSR
jgi:hypothetical protein